MKHLNRPIIIAMIFGMMLVAGSVSALDTLEDDLGIALAIYRPWIADKVGLNETQRNEAKKIVRGFQGTVTNLMERYPKGAQDVDGLMERKGVLREIREVHSQTAERMTALLSPDQMKIMRTLRTEILSKPNRLVRLDRFGAPGSVKTESPNWQDFSSVSLLHLGVGEPGMTHDQIVSRIRDYQKRLQILNAKQVFDTSETPKNERKAADPDRATSVMLVRCSEAPILRLLALAGPAPTKSLHRILLARGTPHSILRFGVS